MTLNIVRSKIPHIYSTSTYESQIWPCFTLRLAISRTFESFRFPICRYLKFLFMFFFFILNVKLPRCNFYLDFQKRTAVKSLVENNHNKCRRSNVLKILFSEKNSKCTEWPRNDIECCKVKATPYKSTYCPWVPNLSACFALWSLIFQRTEILAFPIMNLKF